VFIFIIQNFGKKQKSYPVDNFFNFKNPWQILNSIKPCRRQGKKKRSFSFLAASPPKKLKAAPAAPQFSSCTNWRCVLVKIRTYFQQSPDFDI